MMLLYILIAFLLPVGISILLYFTIIKKKMCDGDLRTCPKSGVNICVKSGTSDADFTAMCTKLDPVEAKSYMNVCLSQLDNTGPSNCSNDCGGPTCLKRMEAAVQPGGIWAGSKCDYKALPNRTGCNSAQNCANKWCGN
jgi:hypothetical protein